MLIVRNIEQVRRSGLPVGLSTVCLGDGVGPAAFDACADLLRSRRGQLFTPALVVAESARLIRFKLGPSAEVRFLEFAATLRAAPDGLAHPVADSCFICPPSTIGRLVPSANTASSLSSAPRPAR